MLDMLSSGCTVNPMWCAHRAQSSVLGCSMSTKSMLCKYAAQSSALACFSHGLTKTTLPSTRNSLGAYQKYMFSPSTGGQALHHSAGSTSLIGGDHGSRLYTGRRTLMCPRASKDVPTSFRYPPMTKKPEWWWRVLACLPYIMPLHETWMYAKTAYNLHPFLETMEFMTYPFLEALGRLPRWFLIAYFFIGYLGVVRRKEWPHFFRFHVVTGMLLEIALQVVGQGSRGVPRAVYWGKVGMHMWMAIAFGFLFTVLECIRCSLAGMYADIPFVSDAAYIQIPYD